jgi:5-methylcytosine-specific restriction endonuclease McrA
VGIEHIRALKSGEPKPPKQRKPIAKKSKKKLAQEKEYKETAEKDAAFYKEIYNASKHECQNCNCGLPKTPSNFMFHHLLPKRLYPQYRYVPENITILCLECHSKCETNIDFAPKIKQRTLEAENNCHKWDIEM